MEINSMSTRPPVPINVQRALWAESCGHCMNPECAQYLITEDKTTSIGDMAHIEPNSDGGDVSVDNLILLCKNCHKLYEPLDNPDAKDILRNWKQGAIQQNNARFSIIFREFDPLNDKVKPILAENYQIFTDYGPHTDDPEVYKLWQVFEKTLIINNARLKILFQNNIRLFQAENKEVITDFIAHANEFEITREGYDGVRKKLFPYGLLSLFDIEEELIGFPASVSALQNLIKKLQDRNQFVSLSFFPEAILTYQIDGEYTNLNLKNYAKVQQTFFNEYSYRPNTSNLRLSNLLFVLSYINRTGVNWSFDTYLDLSHITINGNIRIKFVYSYTLSAADLQKEDINAGYAVNTHNWNDGPISTDAYEYAKNIDLKLFSFSPFLSFCHRLNR